MPKIISLETRIKVVETCIINGDIAAAATEFGLSQATVRTILREVADGKIPEYASKAAYIDDLLAFSRHLKTSGGSLEQAAIGLAGFKAMTKLGVDPSNFKPTIETLSKIVNAGFPISDFIKEAKELFELEKKHGIRYSEAIDSYQKLVDSLTSKRSEKTKLEDEVSQVRKAKADAQHDLDRELENDKVTRAILEQYVNARRAFQDSGLSIQTDLASAVNFINNAKTEGFLEASKELARFRSETGKTYSELLKDYQQTMELLTETQQTVQDLVGESSRLTARITELSKQADEMFAQNNITRQQLDEHRTLVVRLTAYGIDFESLESLKQLLEGVEKIGSEEDN